MSTNEQALTCSICLKRLRCCRLGKPEPCHHVFCFTCIFEWAKNVNTCPVDRIKFNIIEVFNSIGGECVEKVYVADQTIDDEPPDLTYCEVCRDHSREHELLLCDGCDKGYHLGCLTPPLTDVPEGDWYCYNCQPIIDAQYSYYSSTSDIEALMEWGSDSDSDVAQRRRPSKVVITDSEESESDSEVEEIRTRRIIQNICSVGEGRVLISESSESESDDEEMEPKRKNLDTGSGCSVTMSSASTSQLCSGNIQPCSSSASSSVRGGSYVGWLRQFSKNASSSEGSKQTGSSTRDRTTVIDLSPKSKQQYSQKHPFLKPCSVVVTPLKSTITQNGLPSAQTNASLPLTHILPSTSTASATAPPLPAKKTKKKRRRKRRVKLVLNKKKQRKPKKKRRRGGARSDRPYKALVSSTGSSSIRTRSKARTVASYTPQQLTFRAAAMESYRHSDLGTGLENARKIILESGNAFRHSPSRKPIQIITPQSGYLQKTSNVTRIPLREKVASEIKRRTVPEARKVLPLDLSHSFQYKSASTPTSHVSVTPSAGGSNSGLIDKICQNLDDLNNTKNVIQRDGTIVPLRGDSLEPVSPMGSSLCNGHSQNVSACVYHQFSQSQPTTDSYDSSEPELVIDNQTTDSDISEENVDSGPLSKHSNTTQKFFTRTVIEYPTQMIDSSPAEEPSSSTDGFSALIDVTSMPKVQCFVKNELDKYHTAGKISSRQYHRILERATLKVMNGKTTTLLRVKQLVSDFVELYKLSC